MLLFLPSFTWLLLLFCWFSLLLAIFQTRPNLISGLCSMTGQFFRDTCLMKQIFEQWVGIVDKLPRIFWFRTLRDDDESTVWVSQKEGGGHLWQRHIVQKPTNGVITAGPSWWRTRHRYIVGRNGRPLKKLLKNGFMIFSVNMCPVRSWVVGVAPL